MIESTASTLLVRLYRDEDERELLDRVSGFLASPGGVHGLAQAVSGLLANEPARMAMGEAARNWCLPRFDNRGDAPRYVELYEEIT